MRGEEALHTALLRNVYGNAEGNKPAAAALERYVLRYVVLCVCLCTSLYGHTCVCTIVCRELKCLAMTPSEDVLRGQIRFTPLGDEEVSAGAVLPEDMVHGGGEPQPAAGV